jgi:hypothetical protein
MDQNPSSIFIPLDLEIAIKCAKFNTRVESSLDIKTKERYMLCKELLSVMAAK